ncbi:prepilin peptidase [Amycolatopsis minnesotensis]|uniref:Prepilin type IV endopeptidase peptidase domain-containing protein n=1 Tax=Amycolatopsis minnesotensis TaxID=337894 RepID=A0ABP5DZ68_9PSEU
MQGIIVLAFAVAGAGIGLAAALVLARAGFPPSRSWCAAGTAVLSGLVAWRWVSGGWPSWWLPTACLVAVLAVPLVVTDLRVRRLPDVLTLPAYPLAAVVLGLAAAFGPGAGLAVRAAGGAIVFGGAHLAIRALSPGSLGAGDVKLSGALGGVLGAAGWAALPVAAVLAAFVTAALAVAAALCRWRGWRGGVPHGPGLVAAVCLVTACPALGMGT